MSYRQLTYHVVFSTHERRPTILEEHDRDLYAYIVGAVKNMGGVVRRIGGVSNHIHILLDIPPNIAVADCIKSLKQSSSKWLRSNPHFPLWGGWSSGYAAFTVSSSNIDDVKEYVKGQKGHHHRSTFDEEMKKILSDLGMIYDERSFK